MISLGTLTAIGPIASDVYLPAFPALGRHYDVSLDIVQLTLAASFVGLSLGTLVYGPLSDRYGRRGPLFVGLGLFTAASVACTIAPTIAVLIALRFVQGFGGCAGMVIGRAIVRDLVEGVEAARLYSLMMLVFGIAPVLAPLVGGQLLTLGGWRTIFAALAMFGIACLAITAWLPETLSHARRRSGGMADALHSYRDLLGHRAFIGYTLANAFGSIGLMAFLFASPAVIIDQFGVSPQLFGFIFGVNSLGLIVASQIAGRLVAPLGPMTVLRRAITVQAGAAIVLVILATTSTGGLAAVLVPLFIIVSSVGAILPTGTALALTPFPNQAGAASALLGACQLSIGAAIGAVIGLIPQEPASAMAIVMAAGSALALATLLRLTAATRRGEIPVLGPASDTSSTNPSSSPPP